MGGVSSAKRNRSLVLGRVVRADTVEVTRQRETLARGGTAPRTGPRVPWPDLRARRRAVLGDRAIVPGASDVVVEGRDDR